jgi:hypothetical protein
MIAFVFSSSFVSLFGFIFAALRLISLTIVGISYSSCAISAKLTE